MRLNGCGANRDHRRRTGPLWSEHATSRNCLALGVFGIMALTGESACAISVMAHPGPSEVYRNRLGHSTALEFMKTLPQFHGGGLLGRISLRGKRADSFFPGAGNNVAAYRVGSDGLLTNVA
jgi:hypothetical protein